MTQTAPTYDLVLLLDPQAQESARAKIVADARAAIETQGELLRDDEWGERPLSYPIERKSSAEYHLLQFHAASRALLSDLDHTLRITDGVLRFRLIKLDPGTPEPPDMRASAGATPRRGPSSPEPEGNAVVASAPASSPEDAPTDEVPDAASSSEAAGESQTALAEHA